MPIKGFLYLARSVLKKYRDYHNFSESFLVKTHESGILWIFTRKFWHSPFKSITCFLTFMMLGNRLKPDNEKGITEFR
jgi:hypothetical protein